MELPNVDLCLLRFNATIPQHLALIYVVLESVIEEVQVQARTNMSSAMLNHPVLDAGVIGLNLIQSWLKKKLLDVAQRLAAQRLEVCLQIFPIRSRSELLGPGWLVAGLCACMTLGVTSLDARCTTGVLPGDAICRATSSPCDAFHRRR